MSAFAFYILFTAHRNAVQFAFFLQFCVFRNSRVPLQVPRAKLVEVLGCRMRLVKVKQAIFASYLQPCSPLQKPPTDPIVV